MPRLQQAATSLIAAAALGAAAAALAPPAPDADVRALLAALMELRDGHGARQVPQPDDSTRRTP